MLKNKVFLACLGIVPMLTLAMFLNQPPKLPELDPVPGEVLDQVEELGDVVDSEALPEVNAKAFKDKGKLAFVWNDELFSLDGKSGELKQLTSTGKVLYPSWSHDGEYIAFIRVTDPEAKVGSLWIMGQDGSGAFQVQGLPLSVGVGDFQWSPTAPLLAVRGYADGEGGLWKVSVEGEVSQIVETQNPIWFKWSPDGKQLAYNITEPLNSAHGGDILYTYSIDEDKAVEHLDLSGTGKGIEVVGWWPDGRGIIYWENFQHSSSIRADGLDLYSLDLSTKETKSLGVTALSYDEWLSLSPEGKVLMVEGAGREAWKNKNLAWVDIERGNLQYLRDFSDKVTLDASISPDGGKIAFVVAEEQVDGGSYEDIDPWLDTRTLWIADADGSNARALEKAGTGIFQPQWSKDASSILYIKKDALWIIGADGEDPQKVLSDLPETTNYYGHKSFTETFHWLR